ncbi:hypothetical protein BKA82DRAFT_3937261, partial [Pisolithus tinctorius]
NTYPVVARSRFVGRHAVEQLVKGDAVSGLDTVQRHGSVSFCRARVTEERDMLDILNKLGIVYIVHATLLQQGVKDPSIYARANVEATQTIINAAIAAGIHRLVYTSSTSNVFDTTDITNIDGRVPFPEKLFDVYN